ncbi:MAG: dTDP-4-dehydrorhamnose 3,5-epimerase [Robiginitomaculum sp.]
MQFDKTEIEGVFTIAPRVFTDERGVFMESFKQSAFTAATGRDVSFVQDNCSASLRAGTVRGLHMQNPPRAQGKLVSCTRGSILDFVVDIRKASRTYGQHISRKLSADNRVQLWIPEGFLHGFVTLEDDSEVRYKCTEYYAPQCEHTIAWDDADLGLDWGVSAGAAILSGKDALAVAFKDMVSPF